MKSLSPCKRRGSGLLVSTALLFTGSYARNLRSSSIGSDSVSYTVEIDGFEVVSSNDRLDLEDEHGFEAVGGAASHEPLADDASIEWHRSMLQVEDMLEEEDFQKKEYVNDETLRFVSV